MKEWLESRLKNLLAIPLSYGLNVSSEDDIEDWPRYIRITDFDDFDHLSEGTFKSLPMSIAEPALLKDGDLLFARSGATAGKTFLYSTLPNGACYAGYLIRARFKKNLVNPKFVSYFTKGVDYCNWKNRYCIQTTIQNISADKYNQLPINIPSLPVQQRIVDYLNKTLTKIDERIEVLEKQKDAYVRLKKSIIHQAVTRGLKPNVSLKDSGIEWIGMIPEHWEVKRFKSIFSECKSVTETGQEDLLSVSEYYGIARRIDKMDDGEYESRADSLIGYKICKKDDLVINIMLAWKRGLGFSDFDGIVSPAYAVYRGKNIVPHYFHYLMRTDMYVAEYKRNSKGIIDSRLRMYTDRFNNIIAIVPPLSEQEAIASYLDEKCTKIGAAIENISKQIDASKRLKRALINEVITGQRAV